jgi:large subunit ribosomal protein L5
MAVASAMKERYESALRDELRKQFDFKNVMQIPRLEKIVLNIGMGEAIGNGKAMDAAARISRRSPASVRSSRSRAAPSRTSSCASACRSA